MSIELKVADYCQNCPNFNADSNCFHGYSFETGAECHHVVTCTYREDCDRIREYLESQMEGSHLKQTSK